MGGYPGGLSLMTALGQPSGMHQVPAVMQAQQAPGVMEAPLAQNGAGLQALLSAAMRNS
jgi:hypothetical protein